jgi:hypothetical protein
VMVPLSDPMVLKTVKVTQSPGGARPFGRSRVAPQSWGVLASWPFAAAVIAVKATPVPTISFTHPHVIFHI